MFAYDIDGNNPYVADAGGWVKLLSENSSIADLSNVGSIASKADLQTYLTTVGAANSYRVLTDTVTGVQTSIITGTDDAWFTGVGLSTTTTDKVTFSGTGTVVEVNTATSTSRTIITTDGAESRTDTITTTDTTTFETAYDYATEATRLWDIYETVNS